MNEIRWDIRPSPHLGTVEVRIFDGVSNLRELSALVALTHCLIVDLDRRLDAGEQLPTMPPWHVQENKWRAARYGLDAIIILDADSNERLVTDDLDELLNRLEPVAKSLKCADELAAVADHLPTRARPTNANGGWPKSTTATCAPWSMRWSPSWTSEDARQSPMFPLEVAMLPGEELPLRVFEPRYTAMVWTAWPQMTPRSGWCSSPRGARSAAGTPAAMSARSHTSPSVPISGTDATACDV